MVGRESAELQFERFEASPVCSCRRSTNSAPALRQIVGMPGAKNSNTYANAYRPSASAFFMGLSRMRIPSVVAERS